MIKEILKRGIAGAIISLVAIIVFRKPRVRRGVPKYL